MPEQPPHCSEPPVRSTAPALCPWASCLEGNSWPQGRVGHATDSPLGELLTSHSATLNSLLRPRIWKARKRIPVYWASTTPVLVHDPSQSHGWKVGHNFHGINEDREAQRAWVICAARTSQSGTGTSFCLPTKPSIQCIFHYAMLQNFFLKFN